MVIFDDMICVMRSVSLDIIRVIAIYLVIVVHFLQFPVAEDILGLFLFAFAKTCVPLFLLLSGGLLLSKKEKVSTFINKRVKRVVFPWIIWSVVLVFFAVTLGSQPISVNLITATMQSYWFVLLILCLYALTPVLRPMVQSLDTKLLWYVICLWFLGVSLLPYSINSLAFPMSVDNGLVRQSVSYLGLYVLGYVLLHRQKSVLKQSYWFWLAVGLLGFVFSMIKSTAVELDSYFNFFAPGQVLLSVSVFAIMYNYFSRVSHRLSDNWQNRLAIISGLSLDVYFLHELLRSYWFSEWIAKNNLQAYWFALLLFLICVAILLLARPLLHLRRYERENV